MSVTQFIEEFYRPVSAVQGHMPVVGQLCWVAVPHLEFIPFVMDVERVAPDEHYAAKFEVRQMCRTDFQRRDRLPIKKLSLRSTEELLIHRSKKRLAIVVATSSGELDDLAGLLRQRAQKHIMQEYTIVVPLFGVESPEHAAGGFPPVIVARSKALVYPHFLYCPANPSPFVYEAIARLDRLQIASPAVPGCGRADSP